jgi:hypothetical protein
MSTRSSAILALGKLVRASPSIISSCGFVLEMIMSMNLGLDTQKRRTLYAATTSPNALFVAVNSSFSSFAMLMAV